MITMNTTLPITMIMRNFTEKLELEMLLFHTFCTSPFTSKSPSIGTILQTVLPALNASP
jgi:hypothetical protein